MSKKKIAVIMGGIMVLLGVVGCSNGPDDAPAIAWIKKYTQDQGGYAAPKNIKRINGWKQGEDGYVVEYSYDLSAACDYADCVLKALVDVEKNPEQFNPKGLEGLGYVFFYAALLSDRDDKAGFTAITRANLKQVENGEMLLDIGKRIRERQLDNKLLNYIDEHKTNSANDKQKALIWAMLAVESAGVKSDSKIGATTETDMNWKASYRKTEKGWQLTN